MKTKYNITNSAKLISRFYPSYILGYSILLFIGLEVLYHIFWDKAVTFYQSVRIVLFMYNDLLKFINNAECCSFALIIGALLIMAIFNFYQYYKYRKIGTLVCGSIYCTALFLIFLLSYFFRMGLLK